MKIIFYVLLTVGFVICEVPPPYPARGFRPSSPFNLPIQSNFNQRPQPQKIYGPPNTAPSKLALLPSPQIQYIPSNPGNVESLGIRSNSASNVSPRFNSKPTIPSTSYGVPITESSRLQQNDIRIVNSQPQTTYGAPNKPQIQYGAPDTRNVENLDQIRQLNLLLQLRQSSKLAYQNQAGTSLSQYQSSSKNVIPTEQYLPVKDAANFRNGWTQSQTSDRNVQQPSQQYLPLREADNFRKRPQLPEVNVPQRQILSAPDNNFGLSQNRPGPNFQLNNQHIGIPASQYQPSQSTIPQRQVQTAPGFNFGLPSGSSFQPNKQNGIPASQYQPVQSNKFNNNIQNGNNVGGLSQQYVPSVPNSNFQSSESQPNNFGKTDQNIPGNFASNFKQQAPASVNINKLQFSNSNPNNFGGANSQSNFDIQQADVRKLPQVQDNRNSNAVPTQTQFARPKGLNADFGRANPQAGSESIKETYLPPTTTARTLHRPNVAPRPTETPVQPDEQSPELDEEAGGPNISIATAVAGTPDGQSFYLLQPDGRLQRVTYQKTREEGNQENEYTANYLFQNIQADPSLVYSPLITLTK